MSNNTTDTHERLSPLVMTSLGLYLSTASIIGGLENGICLYVFFKKKILHSPINVFIIGLLTSDFLMCTIGAPFTAVSSLLNSWLFGRIGCVMHAFTVYFLGLSNMYLLTAIAVYRYLAITKPQRAAAIKYRAVRVSVMMCYFLGLFWSSMPFFGWSSFVFEESGISCAISYEYTDPGAFSYNVAITFCCFILPICVMLYCYIIIYMTIRARSRSKSFDRRSRIAETNLRIQKKLAKTIAAMIGMFLFGWTPYAITAFYQAFGLGTLPLIVATTPSFFAKTASVWNPVIYVLTNKQFRQALYDIIPFANLRDLLKKREEEESDKKDDKGERSHKMSRCWNNDRG